MIEAAVPGAAVEIVTNSSVSGQHSLRFAPGRALDVAKFLRDDAELRLDFLSNVTGVDWPGKEVAEKVKVTRQVTKTMDGVEQPVEETVEETRKRIEPGFLEVVYHLYSMEKKHGPVVLRMRTVNRTDQVELPSLTSIWRSAEFQEREVFDLYRSYFCRASRPAAAADVGWLQGLSHAAGLRGAGRFRVRANGARHGAETGAGASGADQPASRVKTSSTEWGPANERFSNTFCKRCGEARRLEPSRHD